jgi:hypothetical protein
MKNEEIARYLATHPEFFDQFPHLLTDVRVAHPFDGRAISIAERQILNLRDKISLLENKLGELIQFGEENDVIALKMHHIALATMSARDITTLIHACYMNLHEDFGIPHAHIQLWATDSVQISDDVKAWVNNMPHPQCGAYLHEEALSWLGDTSHLRSYSAIPLKHNDAIGVLILASEDAQRFYPQMGTIYLQRLGELIATGIQRMT